MTINRPVIVIAADATPDGAEYRVYLGRAPGDAAPDHGAGPHDDFVQALAASTTEVDDRYNAYVVRADGREVFVACHQYDPREALREALIRRMVNPITACAVRLDDDRIAF